MPWGAIQFNKIAHQIRATAITPLLCTPFGGKLFRQLGCRAEGQEHQPHHALLLQVLK